MSFLQELNQLPVHQGASHLKLQPIEVWNVMVFVVVFVVPPHIMVFRPVAELGPFLALASMLAGRNVLVFRPVAELGPFLVQVGLSLSQ